MSMQIPAGVIDEPVTSNPIMPKTKKYSFSLFKNLKDDKGRLLPRFVRRVRMKLYYK